MRKTQCFSHIITAGRNGHQAGALFSYTATAEGLLCLSCLGERESVDQPGALGLSKFSLYSRQPRAPQHVAHMMVGLFGWVWVCLYAV